MFSRSPRHLAWLATVGGIVGLCSGVATAQNRTRGFVLNPLRLAAASSDRFSGDSLAFGAKGSLTFGLTGDVAYQPLVLTDREGREVGTVVSNQFYYHLDARWTVGSRLRLGVSLPWLLYSQGDKVRVENIDSGYSAVLETGTGSGLGDPGLLGDFLIVHRPNFRLAARGQVFLPLGKQELLAGEGRVHGALQLAGAGEWGSWFGYTVHGGVDYHPKEASFLGLPVGSKLTAGATLGYLSSTRRFSAGLEVFGATSLGGEGVFASESTPVEALVSGKVWMTRTIRLGAGLGTALSTGIGAPQVRGLASLAWHPRIETAGRTPEPLDGDLDGIPDLQDACPETKGGYRPREPMLHGCPIRTDRDQDGLADSEDACPAVFGVANGEPKQNGCPPVDSDTDGIVDVFDSCPTLFGVATAEAALNGCPSDRDRDGVVDARDACPEQPGLAHPDPTRNGCLMASLSGKDILLGHSIGFPNGDNELTSQDVQVLSDVGFLLKVHPELELIGVEGYPAPNSPDSSGEMGREWANAVTLWLIEHGVAALRLLPRGMPPEVELQAAPVEFEQPSSVRFRVLKVRSAPSVLSQEVQ